MNVSVICDTITSGLAYAYLESREDRNDRIKILEDITAEIFLNLMIHKVQLTQIRIFKMRGGRKLIKAHNNQISKDTLLKWS